MDLEGAVIPYAMHGVFRIALLPSARHGSDHGRGQPGAMACGLGVLQALNARVPTVRMPGMIIVDH